MAPSAYSVAAAEVPFDITRLCDYLVQDKRKNPSNYAIMTISEGAIMEGGEVIETGEMLVPV